VGNILPEMSQFVPEGLQGRLLLCSGGEGAPHWGVLEGYAGHHGGPGSVPTLPFTLSRKTGRLSCSSWLPDFLSRKSRDGVKAAARAMQGPPGSKGSDTSGGTGNLNSPLSPTAF